MDIELSNIGKRYENQWIFRGVSYHFRSSHVYALTGHNGAGKSSLLKIISGGHTPSEGQITFSRETKEIPIEKVNREIAFVAPHVHLVEDFTLKEMVGFHFKFQKMNLKSESLFIEKLNFIGHENKLISKFSSGMMQRLKLGLALYSRVQVILLDEPTSYLDEKNIQWYKETLCNNFENKLLIIATNQKEDFDFLNAEEVHIPDFKK
ncbi:MAG: ATP-binding cassette domain-containing protein [Chitinophagales bacterium]|nr:ATP-binding cassette domain-containing protein [Chitinophagales bacterium]